MNASLDLGPMSDRGWRRILRGVLADAAFIPEAVVEETEILRTAHSAIPSLLVVGADGGALAQLASLSLPFVLTSLCPHTECRCATDGHDSSACSWA